ncbi:hypothetical protein BDU57DRAFT_474111 [Ampelomyces quisqualis]|uniref:Uncharacterized protein n=1 Tax=Ampelomyces quisqualis TaxID=50730 RepID=A0A6A5QL26_AMPQU|nr:hypothetical protein BDU57DRAFT_474111 [Ampelomyces quisqualis]
MDEEEDVDIAAAMGFSSFGGAKKRKFDQTASPKAKADASGANTTQLGVRTRKGADNEDETGGAADIPTTNSASNQSAKPPRTAPKPAAASGLADFLARAQTLPDKPPLPEQDAKLEQVNTMQADGTDMISFGGPPISKGELNALRFGIQNEHGDVTFYLPDFVEDPWVNLKRGN